MPMKTVANNALPRKARSNYSFLAFRLEPLNPLVHGDAAWRVRKRRSPNYGVLIASRSCRKGEGA